MNEITRIIMEGLGFVEGEPFIVKGRKGGEIGLNPYMFTESGFVNVHNFRAFSTLGKIIEGTLIIDKTPFKPSFGQTYFVIVPLRSIGYDWYIYEDSFFDKIILNRVEVYSSTQAVENAIEKLGWEVK